MHPAINTVSETQLQFGNKVLDRILSPLQAGSVTYVTSTWNYGFRMMNRVALSALERPNKKVVWVDGCFSANPYELVRLCKLLRKNHREILKRVLMCRAFTAYQMSEIIENRLEKAVADATLLVVAGFQNLYFDRDVQEDEARVLLCRAIGYITRITRQKKLVSMVVDMTREEEKRKKKTFSPDRKHRHISFRAGKKGITIHERSMSCDMMKHLRDLSPHQAIIDDFRGD